MFGQRHDPRAVHLRRLRSLRSGARGWTVWAAAATGAAAVAVPYAGIGALDILWAGAAGGSAALAALRWRDYRALLRTPVPLPGPAPEPLARRLAPLVGPVLTPMLAAVAERPHRVSVRRGSAAAPAAQRLNQAAKALPPLLTRLGPHAADTGREAAGAHAGLRDLAGRIGAVEKAIPVAPADGRASLAEARSRLVGQLEAGVQAYERLTAAAAECVAASVPGGDRLAVARLTEAAERLAGLAQGFTELRTQAEDFRLSG
jgi:hypothetical protein